MAARHLFAFALLACISMASMASAASTSEKGRALLQESATFKRCQDAYNAAGGDAALARQAPACAAGDASSFDFNACCSQAKAALTGGAFAGCLCDPAVADWAAGRVASAGIQGVNEKVVEAFFKSCGISTARTGGC